MVRRHTLIYLFIFKFIFLGVIEATWIGRVKVESDGPWKNTFKIGDKLLFTMEVYTSEEAFKRAQETGKKEGLVPGGEATVDIGGKHLGIQLYDDWLGDPIDGIYKMDYIIQENVDDVVNVHIIGHFSQRTPEGRIIWAENDGEAKSDRVISIDAIRPVVTLTHETKNVFNPFVEGITEIGYTLEERCQSVTIEIRGKGFDFYRRIAHPGIEEGDNYVSWDGKNEEGEYVDTTPGDNTITPDGDYIYTIRARDLAGNESKPALYSVIKVTSVRLEMRNLNIIPREIVPNGRCHISCEVYLTTQSKGYDKWGREKIYGGEDEYQLQNLGFICPYGPTMLAWSKELEQKPEWVPFQRRIGITTEDKELINTWMEEREPVTQLELLRGKWIDLLRYGGLSERDRDYLYTRVIQELRGQTYRRPYWDGKIPWANFYFWERTPGAAAGKEIDHDLDEECPADSDGERVYIFNVDLPDKEFEGGYLLKQSYRDRGDKDENNDWDTLVPFKKIKPHTYRASFGWIRIDRGSKPGNIIIEAKAELVGIHYKFVKDTGEEAVEREEFWHFQPANRYGLFSQDKVETEFKVLERPIVQPDTTPPQILSVYPGDGDSLSPNELGKPTVSPTSSKDQPYAIVSDIGRGINWDVSYIKISEAPLEIHGTPMKEAYSENTGKLFYKLFQPLTVPGEYKLKIYVEDKAGLKDELEVIFKVADEEAPQLFYPKPRDDPPGARPITTRFNELKVEIGEGNGVGLTTEIKDKKTEKYNYHIKLEKIIKRDEEGKIVETEIIAETGDKNTTTQFKPTAGKENKHGFYSVGTLHFKFPEDVLVDIPDGKPDEYIWQVTVRDASENKNTASETYTFWLDFEKHFHVKLYDEKGKPTELTYAIIPAKTVLVKEGKIISRAEYEKTLKIFVVPPAQVKPLPGDKKTVGRVIRFSITGIKFQKYEEVSPLAPPDKEVEISLQMHYTEADLKNFPVQGGLEPGDLVEVQEWDGRAWQKIKTISLPKEKSYIEVRLKEVKPDSQFALVAPYEPEAAARRYFNPYSIWKEGLPNKMFFNLSRYFPQVKVNKVRRGVVKIYNLRGDLFRTIPIKVGETPWWDGRNDTGEVVMNGVYIAVIEIEDEKGKRHGAKEIAVVIK